MKGREDELHVVAQKANGKFFFLLQQHSHSYTIPYTQSLEILSRLSKIYLNKIDRRAVLFATSLIMAQNQNNIIL